MRRRLAVLLDLLLLILAVGGAACVYGALLLGWLLFGRR